ncbi:hypothetical protein P691DRAFT_810243 [Macrolepiota fuliginosa MF-IS2]|uniref:Uncharacterized protein n=1 Tax=Macrolepiota fuliginosa MF-IS2 TaxID=1400762 RepID=A0A9P5X2Z8_9AGAR|nr:hypothetical protein P691DRAFT_810243 [Macrolepiota fuliginosa MF-IS2]
MRLRSIRTTFKQHICPGLPSRAQSFGPTPFHSNRLLPTLLALLAFVKCTELRFFGLEINASDGVAGHV